MLAFANVALSCGSPTADASPNAVEIRKRVGDSDGLPAEARRYFRSLATTEQVTLARELASHSDPRMRSLGVLLLAEVDREDEAIPVMARLIVDGTDVSGLYWHFLHSGDPEAAERLRLGVRRYLALNETHFDAQERERIREVLESENR